MWAALSSLAGQAKATLDVVTTVAVAGATKAQEQIVQSYEKSQEDLRREERKAKQREAELKQAQTRKAVPLWTIQSEDKSILTGQLKQSILQICQDDKVFLECPLQDGEAEPFPFSLDACDIWAVLALEQDVLLQKTRHRLVRPSGISEARFWRAYFYKVFQLREELGIERLFDPNPPPSVSPPDDVPLDARVVFHAREAKKDEPEESNTTSTKTTKQEEDQFKTEITKFIQEDDFVKVAPTNEPEIALENLEEMLADVEEHADPTLEAELDLALNNDLP